MEGTQGEDVNPGLSNQGVEDKILFVLGIIIIYRIGSFIPTPGVDYKVVADCVVNTNNNAENFIGLVNLFSGGAMLQLSIFALGVMPYITASIVVQLLRAVIPRFEALHKEGQSGEAKLTQYTVTSPSAWLCCSRRRFSSPHVPAHCSTTSART